jgi:hypothetical protein
VREIIRDNVCVPFEKFRSLAKENLGALAAVAISIAGIITTVVVAGKKTVMGAASGLGAVGKALARITKTALPILVPLVNMLIMHNSKLGSKRACFPFSKSLDSGDSNHWVLDPLSPK